MLACTPSCAPVVMRITPFATFFLVGIVGASAQGEPQAPANSVGLFAAIELKTVNARLIPRDSKQATLIISNLTDRSLKLAMPQAFVGFPVLAQFRNPGIGNENGNQGQAPQSVGIGFPNGNNRGNNAGNQAPFNNLFNNPRALNNGFFNVPAQKTIRMKIPTVCLEYGKPDPRPRHAYQVRPLSEFTSDPRMKELLVEFAKNRTSQHVAQLATWHLTAKLSWQDLDAMQIRHVSGVHDKRFATADIRRAKTLVEQLASYQDASQKVSGLASKN